MLSAMRSHTFTIHIQLPRLGALHHCQKYKTNVLKKRQTYWGRTWPCFWEEIVAPAGQSLWKKNAVRQHAPDFYTKYTHPERHYLAWNSSRKVGLTVSRMKNSGRMRERGGGLPKEMVRVRVTQGCRVQNPSGRDG